MESIDDLAFLPFKSTAQVDGTIEVQVDLEHALVLRQEAATKGSNVITGLVVVGIAKRIERVNVG